MIFRLNKGYAPESYYESRDYRVFLKLLGILVSVFKSNIDSFPNLYSPDDCPDNLLPLLANLVGYDYDAGVSVENNRLIVKYFPYLIRNRGSDQGIKLATVLSLSTSVETEGSYTLDSIIVEFDYNTGLIKIYYPSLSPIRKDLLEVVRPVGTFIKLTPSVISESTDELDVRASVGVEIEKYDDRREKVGKSKVGFSNTDLAEKGVTDK